MDNSGDHRRKSKQKPANCDCCGDEECAPNARNNYYVGKRLTPDAFLREQSYEIARRRLINRSIFGWGVAYGFSTRMPEKNEDCPDGASGEILIGDGLAFDPCGRELVQAKPRKLRFRDTFLRDSKGQLIESLDEKYQSDKVFWLLSAHYAERGVAPVQVKDECCGEVTAWDQTCEVVAYSLTPIDCSDCGREQPCELVCDCAEGSSCCGEDGGMHERGGCRCICDYVTNLELGDPCCKLYALNDCLEVDKKNVVPLACVTLVADKCDGWRIGEIRDDCGPRRLIKRNDLLFDLIRGCDLTRISAIGWQDWHRKDEPIYFEDFQQALGAGDIKDKGDAPSECLTELFHVTFSRPVRINTLKPDCVAMTCLFEEDDSGWWQPFRVPILRFQAEPKSGDPAGHASQARMVIDGGWLRDEISSRKAKFEHEPARVEIEIRGDFIIDCNGQAVDANARGLSPAPTGNSVPGDSFISTFTVAQRARQVSNSDKKS